MNGEKSKNPSMPVEWGAILSRPTLFVLDPTIFDRIGRA